MKPHIVILNHPVRPINSQFESHKLFGKASGPEVGHSVMAENCLLLSTCLLLCLIALGWSESAMGRKRATDKPSVCFSDYCSPISPGTHLADTEDMLARYASTVLPFWRSYC